MSDDLTASEKAIAQAMYDIKPNMIGAMKLAKAIGAMVDEKLVALVAAQVMLKDSQLLASSPTFGVRRRPGRPRKATA